MRLREGGREACLVRLRARREGGLSREAEGGGKGGRPVW